ncbi:MAG: hypothetical protein IPO21_13335 [Bacteroidales bacterium]|nr:hypothetical protein [Bacteroidales bacterium]
MCKQLYISEFFFIFKMQNYNPKIHHRRSIRLKSYDYSQAGLYFITICTQDKEHFFGEIESGKMILNDAGIIIRKWYYELENKYPDKRCYAMVIMPNHFHCIIQNYVCANNNASPVCNNEQNPQINIPVKIVGATLCGCPGFSTLFGCLDSCNHCVYKIQVSQLISLNQLGYL